MNMNIQKISSQHCIFSFILLITMLIATSSSLSSTTAATTVDYGDVVKVQYWLYLNSDYSGEPRDSGILDYVYVSQGTTVPSDVQQKYPDASASYLEDFKTNLVGMKEGETKRFVIPAERGYTNPQAGDLYNKDLYFQVTLLKIVYKAPSSDGGGSSNSGQDFFQQNSTLLLLAAGLLIAVIGVGVYNFRSTRQRRKYEAESTKDTSIQAMHKSYDKSLQSLKELSTSLQQQATPRDKKTSSKIKPRSKNIKPRKR